MGNSDRGWVCRILIEHWASTRIITRDRSHQADELPVFAAIEDGQRVGLLTYRVELDECEIISLNGLVEGKGVGTALIEAIKRVAISAGCTRLWLITTNDNTPALRFYQKRGFVLVAIHPNALAQSRRLKPEIPEVGMDGIPLRDEIELEMRL